MLQARITPWVATVVVLPLLVLGAGSQNLLWAFQIGFLGSVALGLGSDAAREPCGSVATARLGRHSCWPCLRCSGRACRCSSSSCASWSSCCGGGSSRRPRSRFRRRSSTSSGLSSIRRRRTSPRRRCARSPTTLWPYVATGLSTAADAFVLDAPLLGSIGLLLLLVYLVRTAERATTEARGGIRVRRRSGRPVRALGLRPAEARHRQATETRYGYIAIVLLAPAIAMVARPAARAVSACRSAPSSWSSSRCWSRHERCSFSATTRPTRRRANCRSGAPFSQPRRSRTIRLRGSCRALDPEPRYSPDLTVADLRRFGSERRAAGTPTLARGELSAAANLQVGLAEPARTPACAVRPAAQSTLVRAGPNGVRLVLNGPPGTAVTFALVDPEDAAQGTSRRIVLDAAWSRLTVLPPRRRPEHRRASGRARLPGSRARR